MPKISISQLLTVGGVVIFTVILAIAITTSLNSNKSHEASKGGPPGTIFKYDLLSNSQPGLNYPGFHLGAFVPQTWPAGRVNRELQAYIPEAATQDGATNEITITAKKEGNRITSARLETYNVWSTAQSPDIKYRGYVEVEATLPVKTNGSNFKGSWPAIWMLGAGNGRNWPKDGEIDIMEVTKHSLLQQHVQASTSGTLEPRTLRLIELFAFWLHNLSVRGSSVPLVDAAPVHVSISLCFLGCQW